MADNLAPERQRRIDYLRGPGDARTRRYYQRRINEAGAARARRILREQRERSEG